MENVLSSLYANTHKYSYPNTVEPRSIVFQGDGENKR